jgi:outer membrane murein-binding lipoprotein Lpp
MKKMIAVALAALALAGCASTSDKEAEKANDFSHSERQLEAAQRSATVACSDAAQCDQAWQLTKGYVAQHSQMPIVRADAVAIESDVPGSSGDAVFSATREATGAGATITLYAQCRGMYGAERAMGSDYDECVKKITSVQNGFAPFLRQHLSAN